MGDSRRIPGGGPGSSNEVENHAASIALQLTLMHWGGPSKASPTRTREHRRCRLAQPPTSGPMGKSRAALLDCATMLGPWLNRTFSAPDDNLDVLRRHVRDEWVDLVYLDPPFSWRRQSGTWTPREPAHSLRSAVGRKERSPNRRSGRWFSVTNGDGRKD